MLKVSLYFIAAGFLCFIFADCGISTLDPWPELSAMLRGSLTPSFSRVSEVWTCIVTTITLALGGTTLGAIFGSLFACYYNKMPVRLFCTALRSVHELFWAILLIPLWGLSPFCGAIAIAIPFTGTFAKVFSEIYEESDKSPRDGVPKGTSYLSRFFFAVFPVISPAIRSYTAYRFECALRSSAVLGFIGIPTIGFYLETMFREAHYSEAAGFLIVFYLLIFSIRYWLKPFFVIPGILFAMHYVSQNVTFSLAPTQYLTELTPWPFRGAQPFSEWFGELFSLGSEGLYNTVILTQISLVTTAVLALALFPFASRKFASKWIRSAVQGILIVMRTTPDFFIAYACLIILGPSMLPAIIALTIHNAAIAAHLTKSHCDEITLPDDISDKKTDQYFFWFLPQVYSQFLAFLFLRWEMMIRESALLGLIGIYTIGFYIDSAIDDDHMDVALALILISGLLTLAVDLISYTVRKRLKLSGASSCSPVWSD